MAYEQARDYDLQLVLGTKKQAAYGTPVADADLTLLLPFKAMSPLQTEPEFKDDKDEIGKGHQWPTRQDVELYKFIDPGLKYDLTSFWAGLLGAFGLGKITTTLVGTLAYQHICKVSAIADDEGQLPAMSIIQSDQGIKEKFQDLIIASFGISGKLKERISWEMALTGSGIKAASAKVIPESVTTGHFLTMRDLKFELGPVAGPINVSDLLIDVSLKANNNPIDDDAYGAGCGLYRNRHLYGDRSVDFSFTLKRSGVMVMDYLTGQTELKAIITLQGAQIEAGPPAYYHSLIVTIPVMELKRAPRQYENKLQVLKAESCIFYDDTLAGPLEWKVINTTASYLA